MSFRITLIDTASHSVFAGREIAQHDIVPLCVVSSGVNEHLPLQNIRLNGLNRNLSAIPDQVISREDAGGVRRRRAMFHEYLLRREVQIAPLVWLGDWPAAP